MSRIRNWFKRLSAGRGESELELDPALVELGKSISRTLAGLGKKAEPAYTELGRELSRLLTEHAGRWYRKDCQSGLIYFDTIDSLAVAAVSPTRVTAFRHVWRVDQALTPDDHRRLSAAVGRVMAEILRRESDRERQRQDKAVRSLLDEVRGVE